MINVDPGVHQNLVAPLSYDGVEVIMFELLALIALLAVGTVILGAFVALFAVAKLAFNLILLPVKILLLPIVAVLAIVKLGIILSIGTAVVVIAITILIPLALGALILAIPFVIFGAFA